MNTVFWDVTRLALVRTDVSDECSASNIRVTRIGELGTALALNQQPMHFSGACVGSMCDFPKEYGGRGVKPTIHPH
jgi:hypothetical protein